MRPLLSPQHHEKKCAQYSHLLFLPCELHMVRVLGEIDVLFARQLGQEKLEVVWHEKIVICTLNKQLRH